jgi:hypothetical protein
MLPVSGVFLLADPYISGSPQAWDIARMFDRASPKRTLNRNQRTAELCPLRTLAHLLITFLHHQEEIGIVLMAWVVVRARDTENENG